MKDLTNEHDGVTRYKWEYDNFLQFVKQKKPERAMIYAKALGIDRRTLVHWMSQPELRDAMTSAIDELVDGMQRAGKEDWRMYREMMKILGVDDETKIDITSGGDKIQPILGGLSGLHSDDSDSQDSESKE